MSVPAHDERDFEFAKKYGLEVRVVVLPRRVGEPKEDRRAGRSGPPLYRRRFAAHQLWRLQHAWLRRGPAPDGCLRRPSSGFGESTTTYRLKDWGVSRQRYWGTPIPMLYCEKDGIVPVPDDQLPVLLPDNVDITQQNGSPLGRVPEFVNATCPRSAAARRGARPIPWTPLSIRPGTSTATPIRKEQHRSIRPPDKIDVLVSDRPVHRRRRACHPSPYLFALLDHGDEGSQAHHQ